MFKKKYTPLFEKYVLLLVCRRDTLFFKAVFTQILRICGARGEKSKFT